MRNRGRTRLSFQQPAEANDGFGVIPGAGWGEGTSIGVSLKPTRGTETERNGTVSGLQLYECEIRYHYAYGHSANIDTTWRATDAVNGRVFNVLSVAQKDDDFRWVKVVLALGENP